MSCFVTGWTFLSWCHHVQLWRGLELDRTSEEGWECTPDSTQTGWGENMRLLCNVKSACCWLSAHLFKWQVYCYFLDECSSFCKTKVDLSLFTSQLDLLCNVHTYILMRYIQWTGLNLFWYMLDEWISSLQEFLSKLISLEDRIADAEEKGKNLESSGYVTDPQLIEAPVSNCWLSNIIVG